MPTDIAVRFFAGKTFLQHHAMEARASTAAEQQDVRTTAALGPKRAAQKIPNPGNRGKQQVAR
ncbi:MAG: hypothetical protein WA198_04290 [Candidatus Sulfotelmatobacter sp.]